MSRGPRPRQTQHVRTEARHGKVPSVTANNRPLIPHAPPGPGERPETPMTVGEPDGAPPMLVRTTCVCHGLRKGWERWVTGDGVQASIDSGWFEIVEAAPPPEPEVRPTPLPDGTPGFAPELPGRIDQWRMAFTPCIDCHTRRDEGLDPLPASPGEEFCEFCLAERDGETPLERALRLAGS